MIHFALVLKVRKKVSAALCTFLLIGLSYTSAAQLRSTSIERLELDPSVEWSHPKFSPDGKKVYMSKTGFDGIWEYALERKTMRQITADPNSGYGFVISPDGNTLAYRRTTYSSSTRERLQELVLYDLPAGTSTVAGSGGDVSLPTFHGNRVMFTTDAALRAVGSGSSTESISLLGIENMKIVLAHNGFKRELDPFSGGSYIWPSLSPDKKLLVAYEITKGTFVYDLEKGTSTLLGRRNAPVWSRDGRWIIFMNDKDDGHQITDSDILAISHDGKHLVNITNTPGHIELYPQCSPTENKIVCFSLDGKVYIVSYEEVGG